MSNILREKIAQEVRLYGKNKGLFAGITVEQIADRILALPEIAEALELAAASSEFSKRYATALGVNEKIVPLDRSASPPA